MTIAARLDDIGKPAWIALSLDSKVLQCRQNQSLSLAPAYRDSRVVSFLQSVITARRSLQKKRDGKQHPAPLRRFGFPTMSSRPKE